MVAKNRRTLAEQEANLYLAQYKPEPVEDPVGELSVLCGRVKSFTAYAEARFLESGDGEWLALHARSMGELAKQLEVLSRLLPPAQAAKAEANEAEVRASLDRIIAVLDGALTDPDAALTESQQRRVRLCIGFLTDDKPPPPGRAGLRGGDVAVEVVDLVRRRGPDYRWTAEERADAEALQRACSGLLARWGELSDVVDGVVTAPAARALEPVVDDAEVVEG